MRAKVILPEILVLTVLVALAWQADTAKGAGFATDGLISYWSFDDIKGETVEDMVGDRDGTMVGDTKVAEGKVGDGLEFDGSGDYVDFDDSGLPEGDADRTFSAWVKTPDTGTIRAVLEWGTNAGGQRCSILVFAAGLVKFCGQNADVTSASTIELDSWVLITETYEGGTVKIYFDDKLDKEQSMAINTTIGAQSFGRIGGNVKVPIGEFMVGIIDEVSIYDRALDEDEVKQNFEAEALATAVSPAGRLTLTWGAIKVSK